MDRHESKYRRDLRQLMRERGLSPPATDDVTFSRYAIRHGYSPWSPERVARCEALAAAVVERARLAELPDAHVFMFPSDPLAEVINLAAFRQSRFA